MREQHPAIAERFADLHPPFATGQAAAIEAVRCLNCFDAPCTAACPTHIDVPKFIKKIASGNLEGSAQTILEANILGASCARVCPVSVLCEGACVMHPRNEEPIQIGRLQRFAMDSYQARGGKLQRHGPRPGKIACIGAGPASLACAAELAQRGFAVTVFERQPLPGGLNTYGVAEYKFPLPESLREIEMIADLGVEFKTGVTIDIESLKALEREYDFIFLGLGLGSSRALEISGGSHPGVIDALGFISAYKTAKMTGVAGSVIVIGAGNTAIDAAIAAHRLGAERVSIVYRRTEREMSAFRFEYEHAKQQGVEFFWQTLPVAVDAAEEKLRYLQCSRVDETLRTVPGSNFSLACDLIVLAMGQLPLEDLGIRLEGDRIPIDDATGQTANPKYFAGGDCVNGGREVVDAVAGGKRAAIAIARRLEVAYA
jgi:dihydropyrimidine dehydrogenase (NAD+) subunit PreT